MEACLRKLPAQLRQHARVAQDDNVLDTGNFCRRQVTAAGAFAIVLHDEGVQSVSNADATGLGPAQRLLAQGLRIVGPLTRRVEDAVRALDGRAEPSGNRVVE